MAWVTITTRSSGFSVTAAVWNELVNNLNHLDEVAYAEFVAPVSVTTTANIDIVSAGAITYEAVPHYFEFWCPRAVSAASGSLFLQLFQDGSDIGRMVTLPASANENGIYGMRRLTPSAASHTYKIVGTNSVSQTSTVTAGAGGAGNNMPGFLRISRIPT